MFVAGIKFAFFGMGTTTVYSIHMQCTTDAVGAGTKRWSLMKMSNLINTLGQLVYQLSDSKQPLSLNVTQKLRCVSAALLMITLNAGTELPIKNIETLEISNLCNI